MIQEMRESLNVLNEQLLETMNDKENLELLLEDKEAALESLTKHCEELKEIASQRRPVDALATPPGMIKYFCPNDSPEESLDFVEEKCDGFGTGEFSAFIPTHCLMEMLNTPCLFLFQIWGLK